MSRFLWPTSDHARIGARKPSLQLFVIQSSPQSFVRKGLAGMGFQIFLECQGFFTISERGVCDQFPRLVLRGMRRLAVVVGVKAGFKIFGNPM
jgi:hypothetical protein